jgi:hypothetical protein
MRSAAAAEAEGEQAQGGVPDGHVGASLNSADGQAQGLGGRGGNPATVVGRGPHEGTLIISGEPAAICFLGG